MIESITGNGYKLEIEYGLENQRISQSLSSVNQYGQTTLLLNKHFIGGLQEKIFYETGAEKTISYISSPEGLTAIEVKSGITSEWYTVFTDHLGSITTLVRESDGSKFELGYDAWGNRRNPATWVNYSGNLPDFIAITDSDFITDRGFTGHEHLDMFGLINMNGRVYDPVASRFLSPDSFIQAPGLALNYNGYVYCLNNPLKYTDPDGEWVHLVIGAVVGGIINWAINGAEFTWEGLGYFGIGAVAGALGAGVGAGISGAIAGAGATGASGASFAAGFMGTSSAMSTGFASGFVSGAGGGFASGFVSGFGNAAMVKENNINDMLTAGLDYGWKGAVSGAIAGGIMGGYDAIKHDRNFWTGAGKQDVVLQVELNGSYDLTSNNDFDRAPQALKDKMQTILKDNKGVSVDSDGQVSIRIPRHVKITGISDPDEAAFLIDAKIGNRVIKFTAIGEVNSVKLQGFRYHSHPISRIRDLFYSRKFNGFFQK